MDPQQVSQTPEQTKLSGTDPTPNNPSTGTADERDQAAGVKETDKSNLLWIIKHYKEMWSLPHRVGVRNTLRRIEYVKGNQFVVFDPYNFSFYDPFESTAQGTQGSKDDPGSGVYAYVNNVTSLCGHAGQHAPSHTLFAAGCRQRP
jgi:hypothetical protein